MIHYSNTTMTRSLNFFTLESAMGSLRKRLSMRRLSVMAFSLAILAISPSCSMFIAGSGKKVFLPKNRAVAVENFGDPKVTRLVKRGDPLISELKKSNEYQRSKIESIYEYDVFLYRGKLQSLELAGVAGVFAVFSLGLGEVLLIPYTAADAGASMIKKHYFFCGYNSKQKPVYFKELNSEESAIVESGRLGGID